MTDNMKILIDQVTTAINSEYGDSLPTLEQINDKADTFRITLSGAPATGYVKSMGYPSSYRDRTREKAMQNTPPKSKGQATKQS